MYYEEEIINGILHKRTDPDRPLMPCSPEYLTSRLMEAEEKLAAIEKILYPYDDDGLYRPITNDDDK